MMQRETYRSWMGMAGRLIWAAGPLACFPLMVLLAVAQEQKRPEPMSGSQPSQQGMAMLAEGRRVFESRCSGCHGLDGRGGERAPDVATTQKTQRRSDLELAQIIENGIPAGGMPGFPMMDSGQVKSVIAYLRMLQGKVHSSKPPGDPRNGKTLFSNRGRCSECHMVQGQGGFIASDLSSFARTHSVEEIRQAITKPGTEGRLGAAVMVTTHDGQKYSGVARNEDNFSLQLQTLDGAFHLFMKSELAGVARQPASLMPADYGSTLSPDEVNDLVSFLMLTANEGSSTAGSSQESKGEEEDE